MTLEHRRQAALALATIVVALAGVPGLASAQQSKAPPGNSGVQEYVETLPDGSGKRATNDAGHAVKDALPESGVVSRETRQELTELGDDGPRAAALAEATAPAPVREASKERDGDGDGGSVLSEVARTATSNGGEGGMGIFLPLFLLAGLVAALGYALARKRAES